MNSRDNLQREARRTFHNSSFKLLSMELNIAYFLEPTLQTSQLKKMVISRIERELKFYNGTQHWTFRHKASFTLTTNVTVSFL